MEFQATVIRLNSYRDSDLILTVIGPEYGKQSLFAGNAKKNSRRFSGSFDLFDSGHFSVRQGRGKLPYIVSFSPVYAYRNLRTSLERLTAASLICECFDHMLKDEMACPNELYDAFSLALKSINQSSDLLAILKASHIAITNLLLHSGLLGSPSELPPSVKNLNRLLDRIEEFSQRRIATRAALSDITSALKQRKAS
ncbi:MAG: DNA repair protein RecO [Candidatus Dadabacteria bacterium]|nr:MAG: DNA repair protein RecO [Candidatus Dadabacteria bacterium]